jgi:hypothetical protein
MADGDSLQDSQRGVPGNIQIPQVDATVATAALVTSQGSAAVFQLRARRTLLEIEQDEVVVCKGNCGLPGLKICCKSDNSKSVSVEQIPGFLPSTI